MAIARILHASVMLARRSVGLNDCTIVERGGIEWCLDLNEGIDLSIYALGAFEPATARALKRLIHHGMTVIDIGANIGAHALPMARLVGNNGRVIAFEPTQFAGSKFQVNLNRNPELAARTKFEQILLTDDPFEPVPKEIYSSWPLFSNEAVHKKHCGLSKETIGASAATLDQYVHEHKIDKIDLIKIDVDGFECKVLRGAVEVLKSRRPAIVMELAPYALQEHGGSVAELLNILSVGGYDFFDEWTFKKLPSEAPELEKMVADGSSINIVALRKDMQPLKRHNLARAVRRITSNFLENGRTAALIKKHHLFDAAFYLAYYPDVAKARIDPLRHYIEIGAAENREPNMLFDPAYYLKQNPDLDFREVNILAHYIEEGAKQGNDPNPLFDTSYYLQQNPDLVAAGINPLGHYLKVGALQGRDPSDNFDTKYYMQQNPDVVKARWNPLAHYWRHGAYEGRQPHKKDLDSIWSALKQYYVTLREIEPLLPTLANISSLRRYKVKKTSPAGSAYFKLAALIDRPFTHLMVLPGVAWGGSEQAALNYCTIVANLLGPDAPLVLCPDSNHASIRERFPHNVRVYCLDDLEAGLSADDKASILVRLVVQAGPKIVHNFNSNICWMAFCEYHRQLKSCSKLWTNIYAYDRDKEHIPSGYAIAYLNRSIDHLDTIITDNTAFKQSLIERFALEPYNQEKIVVAYNLAHLALSSPVNGKHNGNGNGNSTQRPAVLWASRLDREKRPDILLAIAKEMPEIDFHVHGSRALGTFDDTILKDQPNLIMHGKFTDFSKLPLDNISLFLYTSERDGMPHVLLEATARGLPVVAPDVGGISEFITPETGWLIADYNDAHQYVAAIREALASDKERQKRTLRAQQLLQERHTIDALATQLKGLDNYL